MRKYHTIYDYDTFCEMGRVARITETPLQLVPMVVKGKSTTRTQRAFWRLGWEAEDELQRVIKNEV